MTEHAHLTLALGGISQAKVTFHADGSTVVSLYAVMVARKDVTGPVHLDASDRVTRNEVTDSFDGKPLTPHVVGVVERRAHAYLAQARRHLRRIAAAHLPVKEKA